MEAVLDQFMLFSHFPRWQNMRQKWDRFKLFKTMHESF